VPSLVGRENLLRKVRFPRLVVPLSVALTCFFNLCMNLIVVFIFILASGVSPMWSWLELPVLLALLVTISAGVGMLLSALYVRFRDIQPIWDVVCQVLFYASLILIPIEKLQEHKGDVLGIPLLHIWLVNPVADLMQQYRHALLGAPSSSTVGFVNGTHGGINVLAAAGGWADLAIPIGIVVLVVVAGFWVFNKSAPSIAENL